MEFNKHEIWSRREKHEWLLQAVLSADWVATEQFSINFLIARFWKIDKS